MKTERQKEKEEVSIIPPTNAVVHPRAVMVECLDTMITDTAMRATWRSIKLAGDAPLHTYGNAIDLDALVQGRSKVILPFFVRRCFRYNTGIHERRQREVYHHEEGDDSLQSRYPQAPLRDIIARAREDEEECRGAEQDRPRERGRQISCLHVAFRHPARSHEFPPSITTCGVI